MAEWLYGWKDIAAYCGCHEKTAQEYTRRYGLPVRITPTGKPSALCSELDQWLAKRPKWKEKSYIASDFPFGKEQT